MLLLYKFATYRVLLFHIQWGNLSWQYAYEHTRTQGQFSIRHASCISHLQSGSRTWMHLHFMQFPCPRFLLLTLHVCFVSLFLQVWVSTTHNSCLHACDMWPLCAFFSQVLLQGYFRHPLMHTTITRQSILNTRCSKIWAPSRAMSDGSSNHQGHRRTSSTATGPLSKRLQRRSSEGPLSHTETVSEQFIRRPSHSTSPPSRKIFSSGTAFYSRIVEQQANDRHFK